MLIVYLLVFIYVSILLTSTTSLFSSLSLSYLDEKLLLSHDLNLQQASICDGSEDEDGEALFFGCGPLDRLAHATSKFLNGKATYVKKSSKTGCFVAHGNYKAAKELGLGDEWSFECLSKALKIHHSTMTYFQRDSKLESSKQTKMYVLNIEFFGGGKGGSGESTQELARALLDAAGSLRSSAISSSMFNIPTSKPWKDIVDTHVTRRFASVSEEESLCRALSASSLETIFYSKSFSIFNLDNLDIACLVALIQLASHKSNVLRITVSPQPSLVNYEARGLVQGGKRGLEPYRDVGINGEGQLIGIADSGLNDLSCFFIDTSGEYKTITTNRTGVVEWKRRKVVQYIAHADGVDDLGGHGTHVCGTGMYEL